MLVRRELTFFEVLNIIPFTILFHLGFLYESKFPRRVSGHGACDDGVSVSWLNEPSRRFPGHRAGDHADPVPPLRDFWGKPENVPGNFLPELLCTALVAALHIWKRNTLLSIAGGTVAYMLLVQLVF